MIYYANGCSYTWGGAIYSFGLEDGSWAPALPANHPFNVNRLKTLYPHHLGKKIGATRIINESLAGGSNYRIVRKTLEYFNNLLLKNKTITDHFVTIQWTEPSRYEFYDEIEESWVAMTNYSWHFENRKRGYADDYIDDFYNYYYKTQTSKQDFSMLITQIYALGNFFKSHNIPYLFFRHSGWEYRFIEEKIITDKNLRKLLLQFNWYRDDVLLFDMQNSKIDKVDDGHPSILGHKQWAELLAEDIRKKKLILLPNTSV